MRHENKTPIFLTLKLYSKSNVYFFIFININKFINGLTQTHGRDPLVTSLYNNKELWMATWTLRMVWSWYNKRCWCIQEFRMATWTIRMVWYYYNKRYLCIKDFKKYIDYFQQWTDRNACWHLRSLKLNEHTVKKIWVILPKNWGSARLIILDFFTNV